MTKFEDQLFGELMAEHGHHLRAVERPAPARRRARRPVWLATGAVGANTALHRMHARVVVVPVRPGCPPIGSLPRPHPVPHPSGVGQVRDEQARASLCLCQDQGQHPGRGHDDSGVQRQPAQWLRWGGGHHHRARAPLREPPACAVTRTC
jgi:hypothetical protein